MTKGRLRNGRRRQNIYWQIGELEAGEFGQSSGEVKFWVFCEGENFWTKIERAHISR